MKRLLEALAEEVFDVLVLGGGITGAGVALDATLRGLRVALIDKGDFASGTSSISSKLVHGGLRYLEHGHLPLVYEALAERRLLLNNAPHLVKPLRFVLPFYRGARVPAWKWRLGLLLYDLLAWTGNIRRSSRLTLSKLRHEWPQLRPLNLTGGAEYYDAQMDDARLCLEVISTAAEQGAVVANYVEAVAFEKTGDVLSGVRAVDHLAGHEFSIVAKQIVNATGPWVDHVCELAGDPSGPHLSPTKGVHLVVRNLGLPSALLLLHPRDGRVFFVIPWLGKTLVGTTDTAEPNEAPVTPEDIAYLLEGVNAHLEPALTEKDVLNHFVGVRPLIRAKPGEPSSLTREFRLFWSKHGLLSVAGGKYTTYRNMAEIITDETMKRFRMGRPCRTRKQPLDGAPREPWADFEQRWLAQLQPTFGDSAAHLINRYGRRVEDVVKMIQATPALARRIHPDEPDLAGELAYQREYEMAHHAGDFLLRRTRVGLFHPELLNRHE